MELKWIHRLRNAIFPQQCIKCQRDGFLLCVECRAVFVCRYPQHCPGCDAITTYGARCSEHYDHSLDGVVSATWYANILSKKLVRLWKYRFVREAEPHISSILSQWLNATQQVPSKNWVIVPVPLHPMRARARGFDQSIVLARIIAMELGIDLELNLVKRARHFQKPQASLSDKKRAERSFDGVFEVNTNIIVPPNVILVDDVYTTGKTMSAVARELKRSGVEVVWGVTFARGN
ncbi:ComF family protein [Candidatus Uhrbacteria bacterium]|jgi:ComF family protein|nr:ComF family protein [Candidatus Uhrbacteria bacterium]